MLALKTLARLVNDAGDVLVRVEDAVFELTGALRVDLRSGGAVELLVVGSEVYIPVPRGHAPHTGPEGPCTTRPLRLRLQDSR